MDLNKELNQNLYNDKKLLLGVSGGPDSMLLLNYFKDKNIIVCHVNYCVREDSYNDENIVREFCKNNNIKLEVLNLKNHSYKGNFENEARKLRYEFYKKIYIKNKCDFLLLAHHKDDFLETAIMQKESKRFNLYYGIKKENFLWGMNIIRPFVDMLWKNDILNLCATFNLKYALDYTNELDLYSRNKVRNRLKKLSETEKEKMYLNYVEENLKNALLETQILKLYEEWKDSNFDCDFILRNKASANYLIYAFIHKHYDEVKLSSRKINSIYQFIVSSNRTANYKLNDFVILKKIKNKLLINE